MRRTAARSDAKQAPHHLLSKIVFPSCCSPVLQFGVPDMFHSSSLGDLAFGRLVNAVGLLVITIILYMHGLQCMRSERRLTNYEPSNKTEST